MDNKREQERNELHKTIWNIANKLRGSVDGWDFRTYVLGMMFYRYLSENLTNYVNKIEREINPSFDYALLNDKDVDESNKKRLVDEKGFSIYPSELFINVWKNAPTNKDLNITLETIFKNIEASSIGTKSEKNLKGLFSDFDVNSNKLGSTVEERNKNLCSLMNGIGEMKLGDYQSNSIDAFGDAYEYLISMYASAAGKSGGEYFTPQEVSELLMKLCLINKKKINTCYDPACGSGSLLLQAAKILGADNVSYFIGQEINLTTYNLCRMNMFLHDINYSKFDIELGDTLLNPQIANDEKFEVVVSNPPYSVQWIKHENPLLINDPRFAPAGVLAPKNKGDLAFVLHCLYHLANNGTSSIVCFPGVMYRSGAEKKIRQYLIENNYVDCVINLPSNLFFGTSIATCILVLKKNKTDNNVLFIDAKKEYIKITNSNKLTQENINKIIDTFKERKEIKYFSRLASFEQIKEQDFNLAVNTYVEQEDKTEVIDIKVLNQELKEVVHKSDELRKKIDEIIKDIEN